MGSLVNSKIGPYEILAPLGAGGMGEVYRARDPRLAREVAIKVLPANLSQDQDRLQRFEQEAQAAGILNHPNILSVFDIGTSEGSPYLVSELLEGETLRTKLQGGALPQRKAIDYALQIARGLSAAHEKGIVHRDLKPENLFITKDGRVKILDFGLAKLTQPDVNNEQLTQLPTTPGTEPGMILGTVGYMSPEQVRGKAADHRSDIFSFGVILYEMLTGQKAFRGDSAADTMSAILHRDPLETAASNSGITPALTRIVSHCLEKDPEQRFHSASDVGFYLESLSNLSEASSPATLIKPRRRSPAYVWQLLCGVFLVAAVAAGIAYFRVLNKQEKLVRAAIELPPKWNYAVNNGGMALSPDGRMILFVAGSQGKDLIWMRALDKLSAEPIQGTENASFPFWSPDGKFIGFFQEGKLKKIDSSGGPAETICDASDGRGGSWNPEGTIVFSPTPFGPLQKVSAGGGTPVPVTSVSRSGISHRWPYFLPDGRHFLYTVFLNFNDPKEGGIFVGSLDSKDNKRLLLDKSNAIYQPPGYLIFVREANLMAQPFDVRKLATKGDAFRISQERIAFGQFRLLGAFTMSSDRTLAYVADVAPLSKMIWRDPSGKELGVLGDTGYYVNPSISPDGTKTAVERFEANLQVGDIWLYDNARNTASRFTYQPGLYTSLSWSPDGSKLAFSTNRNSGNGLYVKSTTGSGGEDLLVQSSFFKAPLDWSPDGRLLVYFEQVAAGNLQIFFYRFSDRRSIPFSNNRFNENFASFSPDGKRIAFMSDSSGRQEIYVRPISGSGIWQISTNGGFRPRWSRDGKRIYYIDPNQKIMTVEIKENSNFEFGQPEEFFALPRNISDLCLSPDGSRILFVTSLSEMETTPITLVLNWTARIKK
jgi:serine/threonine protein kinase/Tol biopolymer transport system component